MGDISVKKQEIVDFFAILDHIPTGIFILRKDFVVVYWNKCLENWTDVSRDKIINTNILDHYTHLKKPKYKSRLELIFEGGPPVILSSQIHNYVIPIPVSNNKYRIQHTIITPIQLPDDADFYALFTIQDVTEQTSLVQHHRLLRVEATKEVEKRKQIEKKLTAAKADAERSNKLKSAFLANMSHEIRTPLNSIIGYINLMLDDELSPEHREYLATIKNSGNLLLNIINDILSLSKIDAGEIVLERIPFSLKSMQNEIISNSKILITQAGKKITLSSSFPENISSYIIGDPTRIIQVIANLMSNAVKFTEKGFIEHGIELKDERTLEFYIRDTGIGIPVEFQDKIFDRFQQAYSDTISKYGGTGLGLTITKKLVELMGGEIGFRSKQGDEQGSTFYFTLSYEPADEPAAVVTEEAVTEGADDTKTGHNILLVEDNIVNQILTKRILEKKGYRVETANDGREAISKYKSDSLINIILMDMEMPVLNGYDATRVIRNYEERYGKDNRISIVALTAAAMDEDKDKCLDAGCNDYLTKPVNQEELLNTLKKYIHD